MKLKYVFALLLCLATAGVSRAAILFSDDFEQFTNGPVLVETNYLPPIGLSAAFQTNDNGAAATAVTASNFLGSIRAFFDLGTPPYESKYRGTPTIAPTNQPVQLRWTLWIESVQASNAFGGFTVGVLTTNIDTIVGNQTNFSGNPLLLLNDDGTIYAFTNNPVGSGVPTNQPIVPLGTWTNLASTLITNSLNLNFSAGTFSFAMNGVVLTNMPIPAFVTNFLDEVRFDVTEDLTNSVGNRFALDDVQLLNNSNVDVVSFLVVKGQVFTQSLVGIPSILATGWVFNADVQRLAFQLDRQRHRERAGEFSEDAHASGSGRPRLVDYRRVHVAIGAEHELSSERLLHAERHDPEQRRLPRADHTRGRHLSGHDSAGHQSCCRAIHRFHHQFYADVESVHEWHDPGLHFGGTR